GLVAADARPELADHLAWPKVRCIQTGKGLRAEVGSDANDTDGYRNLECDRQEVRAGLRAIASFRLRAVNRLFRRQALLRILDASQQLAVGNALGIDDEVRRGRSVALLASLLAASDDVGANAVDHDGVPAKRAVPHPSSIPEVGRSVKDSEEVLVRGA